MQKGGAPERILLTAVHGLQRVDEIRKTLVPCKKIVSASNGLLDVILEHGDDQFIAALEI